VAWKPSAWASWKYGVREQVAASKDGRWSAVTFTTGNPGTSPVWRDATLEVGIKGKLASPSSETTLDTSSECGGMPIWGGSRLPVIWWKWYPFWPMATLCPQDIRCKLVSALANY